MPNVLQHASRPNRPGREQYSIHIHVDVQKGEQKKPRFVEFRPYGEVPYIGADGFTLYESRAIYRYLASKYVDQKKERLIPDPKDLQASALFQQAVSIESFNFTALTGPAIYEMTVKRMLGQTPDKQVFDALIEQLQAKLKAYEVILGRHGYLAGDEITLADLFASSNWRQARAGWE